MFTTPVVATVLRWLAIAFLRLTGWRIETQHPRSGGYVITFAPHTSYWDAAVILAMAAQERLAVHWLTTDRLFRGPLPPVMRWLGALPVDRTQRTALVGAAIGAFAAKPDLILGLAPEGTRFAVDHWKSGFYRIARGAGVPVVPAFLDYRRRVGGAGGPIALTGDEGADLGRLRAFYVDKVPRRADRFDPDAIRLRPNGQ